MLEKHIERSIIAFLNAQPNCLAWKNGHNGRVLDGQDKWIRTKGTLNGVADITCVYRRKCDGLNLVLFIEVKSAKGRMSSHQEWFKNKIESLNGYYFVVRSVNEMSVILANLEVNQ